jgi:hypothetical protein
MYTHFRSIKTASRGNEQEVIMYASSFYICFCNGYCKNSKMKSTPNDSNKLGPNGDS